MKWLGKLFAFLFGNRQGFTLFLLAAAAAALYAWGATGRADRDRLIVWADKACLRAGATFVTVKEKRRGDACLARIGQLADYERDTTAESARILRDSLDSINRKMAADAHRARAHDATARAAREDMEKANAAIGDDDRVGGDWFAAVNSLGGLRRPAP